MPSDYSVYSIHQAQQPDWLPGEELAATAFLSMTFLLVVEINVQIYHAFKRGKGIYFWAMQIGSVGCFVDAIGTLIKYLLPHSMRLWVLYTLFATVGWAVYTVAQLTVLYSRLHLVMQHEGIQVLVFWMIVIISPILIITDWTTTWPSYNPEGDMSKRWSPAQAVVERICQLGFSGVEVVINIVYAVGIFALLRRRPTVRQRRVMLDLIYVNALAVLFDILNIVLVYLNRVGVSHPVQTFSYTLKLRLEFIALNQLMAVAARGVYRETFGEKRYHNSSFDDGNGSRSRTKEMKNDPQHRPSNTTLLSSPQMYIPPPINSKKFDDLALSISSILPRKPATAITSGTEESK
ncbi:hypothetical protein G7Y79_00068g096120 [Physcia stellaris]|nr:hypothetical protein G7Y79_00068g096120 [Physcia stellaris]